MTGPEHYREAERLAALADSPDSHPDASLYRVAAAQVHATLALAAIQAERWIDGDAHPEWPEVLSA